LGEAALIVSGLAAGTVAITLAYFTRVPLARPPLGTFDLTDVVILLALIVGAPYLYIALPPVAVSSIIGVGLLSTLSIALKPVISRARGIIVFTLLAADALLVSVGSASLAYAANDALAVLTIAAIANIWAQSGFRARDAALLAAVLAIYDPVATNWLGLTNHLFTHISSTPFAPVLAWPEPNGRTFVIGAGDVVVAALLPAVVTKAFGTGAGGVIGLVTVGTIVLAVAASDSHLFSTIIPVMVGLGPVAVGGWLVCRRYRPRERTTYEYRASAGCRPKPRSKTTLRPRGV
jgi:hypothetical protein